VVDSYREIRLLSEFGCRRRSFCWQVSKKLSVLSIILTTPTKCVRFYEILQWSLDGLKLVTFSPLLESEVRKLFL
jgi:hypothetical protein